MQQFPGAVGRHILSKPQSIFTPLALNFPSGGRKSGNNPNGSNGPIPAHGAVIGAAGAAAAMNDFDMTTDFGQFNAATATPIPPPPPLPASRTLSSKSQSTMSLDTVSSDDGRGLRVSTQMSLNFEQNRQMFGEELSAAAAYAPQYGFDTAAHLANMTDWQRKCLKPIWPQVDALFERASLMYKNTRKPDPVEKFAWWLSRHSKDLEKWHLGPFYVCAFCGGTHHSRDEFRFHIWAHAHNTCGSEIDKMTHTLRSADPSTVDMSRTHFMDVDGLSNGFGPFATEDFQMTDASGTPTGWPQSDAGQYIFNDQFGSAWQQPEQSAEAVRIAESFLGTPEPQNESEDCSMDVEDDEAANGQPWMLPEAFPAQQQVAVQKHFHNYESPAVSVKIEKKEKEDTPTERRSSLEILSSWKGRDVSPTSSNASLMDTGLSFSNLVQDYEVLYAESYPLQQHWAGVAGLKQVADMLNRLVCASFYKSTHHYNATCSHNVPSSLSDEEKKKKLKTMRKTLRRHAYDQRFFNCAEAASEIRTEFGLPGRFDVFLGRVSQLTWHFLLSEPLISVVFPDQQPSDTTYCWPPLQADGRIVHEGRLVPR